MQEKSRSKIQASESLPVVILITLSGGLQDAYTYITRSGVFANAQTGNIVLMSGALFSGEWGRAVSYLVPVLSFSAGILLSARLRARFGRRGGRMHWRQLVILLEILLLSAVALVPSGLPHLASAMVSFSCAMQVEAFRKAHGYAYASTMCIGNLRSCMESLSEYMGTKNRKDLSKAGYYALVIAVFGIGAGAGAVLSEAFSLAAILFSPLLLIISFLLMLRRHEEA